MKVYVVSHREYQFPADNDFLPIKVGGNNKKICENYVEDCSGDSIANLNPSFCELTAAYWIWKIPVKILLVLRIIVAISPLSVMS